VSQPSPLAGARQHAQALADFGDPATARALLEHAVNLGRADLGEDDPDVLATTHQLARLHQQADDPSAARRVLEEAYAAGQWRLGDAAPIMLLISHDLGVVAEELGNRHEARRAFGRVAAHGPAALGPEHWAVVRARARLGEDPPTVRLELPPQGPAPAPVPPPSQGPPTAAFDAVHGPSSNAHQAATPHRTPLQPGIVAAPPAPPSVAAARAGSAYSRRAPVLFAASAAVVAAAIAVVALVVALAQPDGTDADPDRPTLGGGPAPTDVRLRDAGSSVQVSWTDPANGTTSFIVSMGHPGEVLKPQAQVGPGRTYLRLDGLNAELDYCFAVVAVYGARDFAGSPQACTSRPSRPGRPSAAR
jgi:Tetratricopeptide repeat